MLHRVFDFRRCVASLQEVITVSLDHVANAFDLNNVRPNAEYHRHPRNQAVRSEAEEQGRGARLSRTDRPNGSVGSQAITA
jgi:hypothetical protein